MSDHDKARPRRAVHPPARMLPLQTTAPKRGRSSDTRLKFCHQIIKEFMKKTHYPYAFPFLQPVDWVALNIPDYPNIVKHPMDVSSIKKKLEANEYGSSEEFENDVRLMFRNCYAYNLPGSDVHIMGKRLESVFEDKWQQLPPVTPVGVKRRDSHHHYSPSDDGI
jgi:bromodomain-containing factor 1